VAPLWVALISNDATGSAAVEKVATLPVACAPVEEVTVAVNVAFCPNVDGSADDGITVVVKAGFTT
jgi:hypothetical protein